MKTLSIDTGSQMTFSARNLVAHDPIGADLKAAERQALRERNAMARELRRQGRQVSTWSLGLQLVSFGGIGSGEPHYEILVRSYGLNYR